MDDSEQHVFNYFSELGVKDIRPLDDDPTDFLLNGNIAVEVRRLNQNYFEDDDYQGWEEVKIPLEKSIKNLLSEFGAEHDEKMWQLEYRYSRDTLPTDPKPTQELKEFLISFSDEDVSEKFETILESGVEIQLIRSPFSWDQKFVLLSLWDYDFAGFAGGNVIENLQICIDEKTQKTADKWSLYNTWWLYLVDHISWDYSSMEITKIQGEVDLSPWDRVVVLDRDEPKVNFELLQ